jgi:hypothetical protein
LKAFWGASLCIWGIFALYNSFLVRRFIVKRYETETSLLNTIYFREHATFTRQLPTLISSPIYIAHLISFLWGWSYFKKKKIFSDIKDSSDVTQLFSKNEVRLVKRFAILSFIILFHCVIYSLAKCLWPGGFV